MEAKAVTQARERFGVAQSAANELGSANGYELAERAWLAFLQASATIFSKLEQGCKSSSVSVRWFAEAQKRRKADPILLYIKQARNAAEHSIEETSSRLPGQNWNGRPLAFGARLPLEICPVDPVTHLPKGPWQRGLATGPGVRLLPVVNRGRIYNPPAPLDKVDMFGASPLEVCERALATIEGILDEADKLI